MGVFQDIGRTKTLQQESRGLAQAALQQRQQAVSEGEFAAVQAEEGRKQKAFDEQEAQLNQVVSVESFLSNATPGVKQKMLEFGVRNNLIDEVGGEQVISVRNQLRARQLLDLDMATVKDFCIAGVNDLNAQINQANQKLQSGEVKNPKEVAELQQSMAQMAKQKEGLLNKINQADVELQGKIAVKEAEARLRAPAAPPGPNFKKVADETSETGFSWQNVNDPSEVVPNAPAPRAATEVSVDVDLSKGTKKELESKILDAQEIIGELNEAENLFKPEFLTFKGRLKAGATALAEKADVIEELGFKSNQEFLRKRAGWFAQAKKSALKWRKQITGVAGGEREMQEIAESFPDPAKDSESEYTSKLQQTRQWTRVLDRWLREVRTQGLELRKGESVTQQGGPSISEIREIVEQEGVAAGPVPTLNEFLSAAREANPNVSDEALADFYNQKYGGR